MRALFCVLGLMVLTCGEPVRRYLVPVEPTDAPLAEIDPSKITISDCDESTPKGRVRVWNEKPDQFREARSCMCVAADFAGLGFSFMDQIRAGRILDHRIQAERIPGGSVFDEWLTFYELKRFIRKKQYVLEQEEEEITVSGDTTSKRKVPKDVRKSEPPAEIEQKLAWQTGQKFKQNICQAGISRLAEGDIISMHVKFTYVEPALLETCYKEKVSCPQIKAKKGDKNFDEELAKANQFCTNSKMECSLPDGECFRLQDEGMCPRKDKRLLADNVARFNQLAADRRRQWEDEKKATLPDFNHEWSADSKNRMKQDIAEINKAGTKKAEGSEKEYIQAAPFGTRMYYREIRLISKPVYVRIERRAE